jgi:hypothetical protein
VIAAAIPDAMLLPTDECFAQEVPEPLYDGLTWREIVSKILLSGGQGFVHCQCKKGNCRSGRCKCRRLKAMCNSRCHMSLSCSNK